MRLGTPILEGDQLHELSQELNRLPVFPALFLSGRKRGDRLEMKVTEPIAVRCDPVVVDARDKIASITRDRRPEPVWIAAPSTIHRCLELGDVEAKWSIGTPLDRATFEIEQTVRVGQGVTQDMDLTAQIGQRLSVARVRPESERDLVACPRVVPVKEQVGDEARVPHADNRSAVMAETQMTQKLDVEHVSHSPEQVRTICHAVRSDERFFGKAAVRPSDAGPGYRPPRAAGDARHAGGDPRLRSAA